MSDDGNAKKTILARRARFIAAAVASVGIACGKTTGSPGPCLSVAYMPADGEAAPMPCLSPMLPPSDLDAGDAAPDAADAPTDGGAKPDGGGDAGAAKATRDAGTKLPPKVPTRVGPTPIPQPCLSVLPNRNER
jgi:hypothetical protein